MKRLNEAKKIVAALRRLRPSSLAKPLDVRPMSIYSGLGVAASIREARKNYVDDDEDETKDLPMREELLLAKLRKQVGGKALATAPKRASEKPIDWRSSDAPAGQPVAKVRKERPTEAPPGWSKGSWSRESPGQALQPSTAQPTEPEDGKLFMSKAERRKAKKAAVVPMLNAGLPGVEADVVDEFSSGRNKKNAFGAPKLTAPKASKEEGVVAQPIVAKQGKKRPAADDAPSKPSKKQATATSDLAAFAAAQVSPAVQEAEAGEVPAGGRRRRARPAAPGTESSSRASPRRPVPPG